MSQLAILHFDIEYRKGKCNSNADTLSGMSSEEVTKAIKFFPPPQNGKIGTIKSNLGGRKQMIVSKKIEL